MLTSVDVGNSGQSGLDRFVVGQDDDMTVGLEIAQLRQVVIQRIGDILQIDTDGVTDTDTRNGIKVKLKGGSRGTVLDEGGLVEVARLLIGGDNAVHRGVIVKYGTRFHFKNVSNGVNRTNRQVLNRRFGILFLAGGEHHAHHGKQRKDV